MESEANIKEKELLNIPKSIPYQVMEILGPKLKKQVCKIECHDGGHGTGYFCNIPDGWNNLKVLMTNNHALNQKDINTGKNIKFSLNNEEIFYEIKIDESRKIYTDEKYDVTIIELSPKDKLDKDKIAFFEIDDQIFEENSINKLKNRQIFLLHYPKGNQMECSIGLIKNIDNFTIRHLCDSSGGSSGAPIINSYDYRVIGIHKGGAEGAKNYNVGTFLKEPLKAFLNKYNQNENIKEDKKDKIEENENDRDDNIGKENIKKDENDRNEDLRKDNLEEKKIIENVMNENIRKDNVNEDGKNGNENVVKEKINENENEENNGKKNIKEENVNKNCELINEDNDETIIKYKIDNIQDSKEIRIFGYDFVENNKDKCKLKINGKIFKLTTYQIYQHGILQTLRI